MTTSPPPRMLRQPDGFWTEIRRFFSVLGGLLAIPHTPPAPANELDTMRGAPAVDLRVTMLGTGETILWSSAKLLHLTARAGGADVNGWYPILETVEGLKIEVSPVYVTPFGDDEDYPTSVVAEPEPARHPFGVMPPRIISSRRPFAGQDDADPGNPFGVDAEDLESSRARHPSATLRPGGPMIGMRAMCVWAENDLTCGHEVRDHKAGRGCTVTGCQCPHPTGVR